ncbi:metallophosphoesterase [Candidatus Woesearchaeota archaeon]|nr:metallophosphoesterase [Candidatus Woesearchaeota archaeon]
MKILAFADVHGSMASIKKLKEKAEFADLLVCAGDISNWSTDTNKMLKELSQIKKPLLMINGNHESDQELREQCKRYKNILFIHNATYEVDNYVFFGYGGGGFSLEDEGFVSAAKKFKKTIKKSQKVILITHAPPYNTRLDELPFSGHAGCKSIRDFIDEVKPILSISGHLHENFHIRQKIGETVLINPGPDGKILEI